MEFTANSVVGEFLVLFRRSSRLSPENSVVIPPAAKRRSPSIYEGICGSNFLFSNKWPGIKNDLPFSVIDRAKNDRSDQKLWEIVFQV